MRRFKVLATGLAMICLMLSAGWLANPGHAAAFDPFQGIKSTACNDAATTSGANAPSPCDSNASQGDPVTGKDGLIAKVADIIAFVSGIVAVIVIIVAGLQYVLSAGDSQKVGQAKDVIIYAVIGLVIVMLAETIVQFAVGRL